MDQTTDSLIETFPREEDLIKDALKWLVKYKAYRDDTEGGGKKAVEYNDTWLKFISRCKDYKNQPKLINWLKQLEFDQEIKDKLLEILEPKDDFDLTGEILKTFDQKI
jgi:hypothetical protein